MGLLEDLEAATGPLPCGMCDVIRATTDEDTRRALTAAAAGTIGYRRLNRILAANGQPVSDRQIRRHRQEGHQP
jgi:hypothetical protein